MSDTSIYLVRDFYANKRNADRMHRVSMLSTQHERARENLATWHERMKERLRAGNTWGAAIFSAYRVMAGMNRFYSTMRVAEGLTDAAGLEQAVEESP